MNRARKLFALIALIAFTAVSGDAIAQQTTLMDHRPTIAVPLTKSQTETHQKYLAPITLKLTEVLRESKRFIVVSRTDEDVMAERNFQQNEEFLDRKLDAKSNDEIDDMAGDESNLKTITTQVLENGDVVFFGAEYILVSEVRKLDLVRIKNHDNTVAGYKALIGLQLSVNNTATNTIVNAQGFQSLPNKTPMFSPQRAMDEALLSLQNQFKFYFLRAFPLTCNIVKMIGKDVMIDLGQQHGVSKGQTFTVFYEDGFGDEKFDVQIGEIKIKAVNSANFSQCAITQGKNEIIQHFSQADKIKCVLQQ